MTYAEALEHLYSLGPELQTRGARRQQRFNLDDMRTLCAALGNPERRIPSVLIAGTNGKGSTAATLASILTAAGYRAGLYTSPHLVRVNERIQVGRPSLPGEYGATDVHGSDGALELAVIPDEDFASLYTHVDVVGTSLVAAGSLPQPPSFFERLTAVAFLFFSGSSGAFSGSNGAVSGSSGAFSGTRGAEMEAARADILVLEVGLGGRLDATNVVEPLLSILTDIALDHQEYLGDTIGLIAREKCGILRPQGKVVTLAQHPEANQAIGEVAAELGVQGIDASPCLPPALRNGEMPAVAPQLNGNPLPANRYTLTLPDGSGQLEVDSPLPGAHQQRNIALALTAALALRNHNGYVLRVVSNQSGYEITNAALAAGIRTTAWPGRLQWIEPNLLLDVAHNPAGAWTLRAALAALPSGRPRTLVFSCLGDKDLRQMGQILFPLFDSSADGDPDRRQDHIVMAPIANPRAAPVDELLATAHTLGVPAHAAPHLSAALEQARRVTPPGGLIVVTGSVYLVGEVERLLSEGVAAHA